MINTFFVVGLLSMFVGVFGTFDKSSYKRQCWMALLAIVGCLTALLSLFFKYGV